ncbi:unknown [Eggerthella sp. CAG:1427]|nr:unknown [Eggerthella sp. CAG:1427]
MAQISSAYAQLNHPVGKVHVSRTQLVMATRFIYLTEKVRLCQYDIFHLSFDLLLYTRLSGVRT